MPSTKTPCCTFPRLCATIHQPPHNAMVPNSSTHLGHTLPLLPANTSRPHLVQVVQVVRECALLAHPPTWITPFHSCPANTSSSIWSRLCRSYMNSTRSSPSDSWLSYLTRSRSPMYDRLAAFWYRTYAHAQSMHA